MPHGISPKAMPVIANHPEEKGLKKLLTFSLQGAGDGNKSARFPRSRSTRDPIVRPPIGIRLTLITMRDGALVLYHFSFLHVLKSHTVVPV
jgi:hypothetical protein